MSTNTAYNPAMATGIGMNTAQGGNLSTKRQFKANAVEVGADGTVWVYGKANAALTAGAIAVDQTTTAGQNTLKAGTGYVIDKDVASGAWYWARSVDGGVGPADDAIPTIALAANVTNNLMNVTVTWKDSQGNTIAGVRSFRLYLSDASTGIGLTATTLSGSLLATTGSLLTTLTAKKEFLVETAATGVFVGTLTDTAETATFYVVAVSPSTGSLTVSSISGTNWG